MPICQKNCWLLPDGFSIGVSSWAWNYADVDIDHTSAGFGKIPKEFTRTKGRLLLISRGHTHPQFSCTAVDITGSLTLDYISISPESRAQPECSWEANP